jgi:hypothetical protein
MPESNRVDEAMRILENAHKQGVVLRALGGIGIRLSCEESTKPEFARTYNDLDFIGHREQALQIRRLFEELGYLPNRTFNALHGRERLIFNEPDSSGHVDIFLDRFRMCHTFDLMDRLEICEHSLSPSDLFLTKIQVVATAEKDLKDLVCLVASKDIGYEDNGQVINIEHIAGICARDWGIYKTVTTNLSKTLDYLADMPLVDDKKNAISSKAQKMVDLIEQKPKSLAWKARARVGTKKRWYDLPEDKERKIAS